jgi:hypothetical protein
MATPLAIPMKDTETVNKERNGAALEEKKPTSQDEIPKSDLEAANGVNQNPHMTFRRFMAIFSLGCLLAAAQIPIYLIGGALCKIYFEVS